MIAVNFDDLDSFHSHYSKEFFFILVTVDEIQILNNYAKLTRNIDWILQVLMTQS